MKRILVADDHLIIRKGLKQILKDEFGDIEFGEAVNSIEVFRKIKEKRWDALILDINMPGRSGFDVLKQLKDSAINVPVLALSMLPEEQVAIRALKAGACGYLTKNTADTELVTAMHKILNGKKYISSMIAEKLACEIENPLDKVPHELLSDREFQTLIRISSGKSVSQIAEELLLSVPTISTYRTRILKKMKMKTTAALINYSVRNNLV